MPTDVVPALNMVRLRLSLPHMFELGRRRRLPPHETDEGYLVHCQLRELFGELAPQPFAVVGGAGRALDVLGYAAHDLPVLRRQAQDFADPATYSACDWSTMASKGMPARWDVGRRLGFSLRACPVVRMSSAGEHHRKGAEVDAFVAHCRRSPEGPSASRPEVYTSWLRQQLERRGGATLVRAEIGAFRRRGIVRRTQGVERRARVQERPDVLFQGELEVTTGDAFAELLRGGVGRHRAFGFGMLLLRPTSQAQC